MEKSFAQAEMFKKVHNLKKVHLITPTLHKELDLIRQAFKADWISKASPIAHLIPDLGDAFGDSSRDSAGAGQYRCDSGGGLIGLIRLANELLCSLKMANQAS